MDGSYLLNAKPVTLLCFVVWVTILTFTLVPLPLCVHFRSVTIELRVCGINIYGLLINYSNCSKMGWLLHLLGDC